MIRRLLTAWRHADEIAELRDRAVREAIKAERIAEINRSLIVDNARLIGRLDQADSLLRDAAQLLRDAGHATNTTPCPICAVINRIDTYRNTANQPAKDHRQP